ncbi:OB fold-containing protein [Heterostelium album PN500]|uniref:OB fold-containing protein n=1 Tax=Heterostelium pallidum (strain ATCC 26659 / Pp 5 / PN500) TaxID=670386 RepID=D3BJK7_HETP5|nr:OB fold-containing protein [Heterostelium album PN500]EFA78087.1 OB fold-containing protein [Heterostelium album PN500]|eukprot:XP_020430214.1 OB fold-containing protein [Heterostelium album PN500]
MSFNQSGNNVTNQILPQQQQPPQSQQQQQPQQQPTTGQQQLQQSQQGSTVYTKILDIKPYAKNINTIFIVLEKMPPIKKKDLLLYQVLVADGSASINMTLFDVYGEQVQPGDILRLRGGYASIFHESLFLYVGKSGVIERIGEFTFTFVENPNLSANPIAKDDPNIKNVLSKQGQIPTMPGKMKPMANQQQQQQQQPSNNPTPPHQPKQILLLNHAIGD